MGLWESRDYRWWLAGDSAGMAAITLRQFAVPLVAYALSGSPELAGLVGTVQVAVATLAALPGGVLLDRHDRRRTIQLQALAGVVIWGAVAHLAYAGLLSYWLFLVLAALGALFAGLFGHATDAALRSIVSTEDYPKALATNEGRDAAVQLASGPAGGALYALATWAPFATAIVGHVITLFSTFGVRADLRPGDCEHRSIIGDLATAGRWLASSRRFRVLGPLFSLANLGVSGVIFTYQLSLLERGYSGVQIGWLAGCMAASTLVGAIVAGPLMQRVPTGPLTAAALAWLALALVPTAFTDAFPVMLGCVAAAALLLPATNSGLAGFLFSLTPTELQGRVQTLVTTLVGSLTAIAPLLSGILLPRVGFRWTVASFLVVLVACALLAAGAAAIRTIPRPAAWKDAGL